MARNKAGWAIWVLSAAALYFFENNTGTRAVLAISVILPAVSILCARAVSRCLTVSLLAPESIGKGKSEPFVCSLIGSELFPLCAVSAVLECENTLTGDKTSLPVMFWNGAASPSLGSSVCGNITAALRDVQVRDLFGICRFPVPSRAEAAARVLPDTYPVRGDVFPEEDLLTPGLSPDRPSSYLSEPDGSSIREYIPGDPVRMIHWKLSAKTGRLLIRENTSVSNDIPLLLLDTAKEEDTTPEDISLTAEAYLSVSRCLLDENIPHEVCFPDDSGGVSRSVILEEGDLASLIDSVMSLSFRPETEPAARLFSQAYPGETAKHIFLFSACEDTSAVDIMAGSSVTLILPRKTGREALPGIRLLSVSGTEGILEL